MNSDKESPDKQIEELSFEASPSIDDFIRELEEKEKDLNISSDLVVEVEESDIPEEDSLEILQFLDSLQPAEASNNFVAKPQAAFSGSSHNISKLENEIEKLREQVSKFEIERTEVTELVRRRQYDFENYRKRTERERVELTRNLLSNMAAEILPVLDNLRRALDSASSLPGQKSPEFQQFVDGVGLVNQQLNEVLEEMGIHPIISVGEQFDPHLHEAVSTEPTDEFPPHTVIAELVRGYRIGDKVIRHSMVKVSTPKASQTFKINSETE
jgi:molecular chaperone GrpE (heat shock protein)